MEGINKNKNGVKKEESENIDSDLVRQFKEGLEDLKAGRIEKLLG